MTEFLMPEVNLDESQVAEVTLAPLGVDAAGAPLSDDEKRRLREEYLDRLARCLYGPVPAFEGRVTVERIVSEATPGFTRLAITVEAEGGRFEVDAGLWLPAADGVVAEGSVPLVVALDFLGPLGVLNTDEYPLDPDARVVYPFWYAGMGNYMKGDGALTDVLRGSTSYRWPVDAILERGWGLLLSCYGSWVPDDDTAWRDIGVVPLLGLPDDPAGPRVISLWAWAISRLVDVALELPETDAAHIATIGFSRLGKAAAWAAANDERIGYALVHESGAAGASLSARNFGETLQVLRGLFPHWVVPDELRPSDADETDQHHLLASVWPRHLFVASAEGDAWADPRGEYLAFKLASTFWDADAGRELPEPAEAVRAPSMLSAGPVQYHCRIGGHELTTYDWWQYMDFLERYRAKSEAPAQPS